MTSYVEYVHLKTGNVYEFIGYGVECTNGKTPCKMAVYRRGNLMFVREAAEFHDKFKTLNKSYADQESPTRLRRENSIA